MKESSLMNNQIYYYLDNIVSNEQDLEKYKMNNYPKVIQNEQKQIFPNQNSSFVQSHENGFNSNPSSIPITQTSITSPDISVSTSYSNPQLIRLQKKTTKEQQQQLSPKPSHIALKYNLSNENLTDLQKYQSTVNINPLNENKINLPGNINSLNNANNYNSNNENPFLPINSINGLVSPKSKMNEQKTNRTSPKIPIPLSNRNRMSPPIKHKFINKLGQNYNGLNYNSYNFNINPNINVFNSVEIKNTNNSNFNKDSTLEP